MRFFILFCIFAAMVAVYADANNKPCENLTTNPLMFRPRRADWIDCKNDSDCPEGKKCVWICNGRGYCS